MANLSESLIGFFDILNNSDHFDQKLFYRLVKLFQKYQHLLIMSFMELYLVLKLIFVEN